MRGGVDAIYDDLAAPTGLSWFAPTVPARGAMFPARRRAGRYEQPAAEPVIAEAELYRSSTS